MPRPLTALAVLLALTVTTACGPLVGAGVAVGADRVVEEEEGGEGLF
jgi:hypothetical protein